MERTRDSKWQGQLFAVMATITFFVAGGPVAAGQKDVNGKFKVGDRVDCDASAIGRFEKGTVVPFLPTDRPDGRWYRVMLDGIFRRQATRVELRPDGRFYRVNLDDKQNAGGSPLDESDFEFRNNMLRHRHASVCR